MESIHEIIPFAKEMLSTKPNRGMLKVYLVGSVFAVLGTIIGLVETVCLPLSSSEPLDTEMALMMARERRAQEAANLRRIEDEEVQMTQEVTQKDAPLAKTHEQGHRSVANRLHAS
ncbi:G0/G1 switch protein 2 [Lampris incognitus]|uniref:G0/G1 switch protein 2 n=1 Tax=Lampris incognitus TaxID=2546036 RepID=UPI0024B5D5A4|nr:G0/G1 switch protein 2 [Lampris incognitus]